MEILHLSAERSKRCGALARAARLSDPARRLLEAVAVVPGSVEMWLLDRLAGDLVEPLGECLDSGMLTAGRAHVAVRHELARLAIEDATPPHRRLALHRAALAAHGDRAPDPARLAHHAEAAGPLDEAHARRGRRQGSARRPHGGVRGRRSRGNGIALTMVRLPPPDPNEFQEPEGFELTEPVAVFLAGPPTAEAARIAAAVLDCRPGALVVAAG